MSEKKRVLILQHILDNPAGRVGDILDEHEIFYDLIHVGRDNLPDPGEYQALVVLGGSEHVYDKRRYLYTLHEEACLYQAIKQGIPYLGMCLGGQLLTKAFHTPVKKLPKVHIGFLQIHFTEAGQEDPLYKNLPGYQQAFQWHEDCFLLPKGAVSLAQLTDGFNQAFRYEQHAYGLQYHIDLTEDMLDTWLHDASLREEFIDTYGSEAYRKVEQEAIQLFPTYAQHVNTLLKNFFRLSGLI
ncbi:MAG TPA: type 1 glutamine amidotransferase [Ktedonobacteraceae bacterium]|nr:type 1 glutamine amidotransferase [Ktedonobacteraceae bacterium]